MCLPPWRTLSNLDLAIIGKALKASSIGWIDEVGSAGPSCFEALCCAAVSRNRGGHRKSEIESKRCRGLAGSYGWRKWQIRNGWFVPAVRRRAVNAFGRRGKCRVKNEVAAYRGCSGMVRRSLAYFLTELPTFCQCLCLASMFPEALFTCMTASMDSTPCTADLRINFNPALCGVPAFTGNGLGKKLLQARSGSGLVSLVGRGRWYFDHVSRRSDGNRARSPV